MGGCWFLDAEMQVSFYDRNLEFSENMYDDGYE